MIFVKYNLFPPKKKNLIMFLLPKVYIEVFKTVNQQAEKVWIVKNVRDM